ncbi:MAG TPA: D-alanyl-D-alanine carboxypeptidase/D-alanyl-D-alanine-endopeptidase [Acidimicrobiales bacterium]|nr:D-alanyl-D-alanine carboxypeptidase/D-alanyl-D-alanine-endopeptidase [Acidimicrobiales bacterium]
MPRHLASVILGLVAVACAAVAVRDVPAAADAAPVAQAPSPLAPVLSPRRVPAALLASLAERRQVAALDAVVQATPPGSCLVVEQGDRTLVDHLPNEPVVPASTLKLLTAVAVLEHLPADERLVTTAVVAADPVEGIVEGDLWLVGGGDPVLGTADWAASFRRQPALVTLLEAVADRVRDAGITVVRGGVIGDESRYDQQRYVASWPVRYALDGQIGPLSALSVNDGFSRVPPMLPFADPAVGAAGVLTELLRARGIEVVGEPAAGVAPSPAVPLASVESPPVSELVRQLLRESDNGTAELLLKELGLRVLGQGSTAAGARAVIESLAARGLPLAGVSVLDGSGLDPGNRVTCRLLLDVLATADPAGPITTGLSVAGESGTLAHRYRGTDVAGVLRAKTGSIRSVSALVGEVQAADGRRLRFAYVANGLEAGADGGALQDMLVTILTAPLDLPALDPLRPGAHP